MNLSRTLRIAGREVRSLLSYPGGFFVVGTFWAMAGLMLVSLLFRYREASMHLAQAGGLQATPMGLHVNDMVIRPFLYNLGTLFLFFVPLLTMRGISEERRTGSLELLLSQPLRGGELLLGKYLGALGSLGICLSVLVVHAVVLARISTPDWPAALAGLAGVVLLGSLFCALGILISVLSRSQIEAGVLSLGLLLVFALGPQAIQPGSPAAASVLEFFTVMLRFEDFARGILDLGHVGFFIGAVLLIMALALRSLDLVRWQG